MTTYFPFVPSSQAAPTFQAILDGNAYNMSVRWSLFGKRYYLYCYDQSDKLVFTVPVVTSTPGVLMSKISWDAATLSATAVCGLPHLLSLGSKVELTIAGCVPAGYNGAYSVVVTSPASFAYPLSTDPGGIQSIGTYSYIVSLSRGYFTSTIIYRNGQFEVSP